MLTISLANVLIINNNSLTNWTNVDIVGVPGVTTFNNNTNFPPALIANESLAQFINAMNDMSSKLTFEYDYAVGVMKYTLLFFNYSISEFNNFK